MKRNGRAFACFVLLLIAFVLFASLYFILHEAHHDCSGEECPVCRTIALCRETLRSFAFVTLSLFALVSSLCAFLESGDKRGAILPDITPVSLKVRLLN